MVVLLRVGRRRLPDVSWALLGAAVAITGVVAALYHVGPDRHAASHAGGLLDVGGRASPRRTSSTCPRRRGPSGLLLGAAFAMVWRPAALHARPDAPTRGRVLDGVAVVGLVGLGALCGTSHRHTDGRRPVAVPRRLPGDGVRHAGRDRRRDPPPIGHGPLLGNPVFVWLGTRSYGLYLYHWPIFQGIRRVAGNTLSVPQFTLGVAAAGVVAELSYRYIETPIRKRRARPGLAAAAAHGGRTPAAARVASAPPRWSSWSASPGPAWRRRARAERDRRGAGAKARSSSATRSPTTTTARRRADAPRRRADDDLDARPPPSTDDPTPSVTGAATAAAAPAPTPVSRHRRPPDRADAPPTTAPPPATASAPPVDPCGLLRSRRYALGDSVMLGAAASCRGRVLRRCRAVPGVHQRAATGVRRSTPGAARTGRRRRPGHQRTHRRRPTSTAMMAELAGCRRSSS